ncbi:MAG: RidA family protein [Granulosicoccus sp.]|nr:RidA family protein [Granulosicoccus sp.]
MTIERVRGVYTGRNRSTAYKDLVWTVATSADDSLNLTEQTLESLNTIEKNLVELGSSKQRILSAQVFLTDLANKTEMDKHWCAWLGDDPQHWPQRACVGVQLAGNTLIEITVVAARD